MIHTEKYEQFKNSKDFELILKKSYLEFGKSVPISFNKFCQNILPDCKMKGTIMLIYNDKIPIGYFIIQINNRKVYFFFSYIDEKERGKGYSNLLRSAAFDLFKDKFDNLTVYCDPKNIASYKGLHSLLKRYNCKYNISEVMIDNKKHEKYEIQKFE